MILAVAIREIERGSRGRWSFGCRMCGCRADVLVETTVRTLSYPVTSDAKYARRLCRDHLDRYLNLSFGRRVDSFETVVAASVVRIARASRPEVRACSATSRQEPEETSS